MATASIYKMAWCRINFEQRAEIQFNKAAKKYIAILQKRGFVKCLESLLL